MLQDLEELQLMTQKKYNNNNKKITTIVIQFKV